MRRQNARRLLPQLAIVAHILEFYSHQITVYPSVLAPAGESIQQMSLMTAQIQEKTAALATQEETMHSLRCSEERLAKLAGNQRQHIQDLQAKLMDSLCEVRLPVLQL